MGLNKLKLALVGLDLPSLNALSSQTDSFEALNLVIMCLQLVEVLPIGGGGKISLLPVNRLVRIYHTCRYAKIAPYMRLEFQALGGIRSKAPQVGLPATFKFFKMYFSVQNKSHQAIYEHYLTNISHFSNCYTPFSISKAPLVSSTLPIASLPSQSQQLSIFLSPLYPSLFSKQIRPCQATYEHTLIDILTLPIATLLSQSQQLPLVLGIFYIVFSGCKLEPSS